MQNQRIESIKSYLDQDEIKEKLPLLFNKLQFFDKKEIIKGEASMTKKVVNIPKYKHKKDHPVHPFFKPISKM